MYLANMRIIPTLLLCLLTAACAGIDLPPPDVGLPPDEVALKAGVTRAISESHFAKPIEVTDVIRAPLSSTQPWMVCIRSATSDEARRLTYSAFFGKDSSGKDGQYSRSRYSVFADNCDTQTYHTYADTPSPAPVASPTPEPKKHHRHNQG